LISLLNKQPSKVSPSLPPSLPLPLTKQEDDWREPETEDEHETVRNLQLGGQGADAPPGYVIDIRGGSVYFEPGTVGGTFNGKQAGREGGREGGRTCLFSNTPRGLPWSKTVDYI